MRHGLLDRRPGDRATPGRSALRGSLPRRAARNRRAGRDPPRGLERGAPRRPRPARPPAERAARYALWKNSENLTGRQRAKLADVQQTNRRLYRAYLLKEQLRQIYRLDPGPAITLLDGWIAWARRCRLPSFVKLARTIREQRAGIVAAIEHGLSNARVEAINTQIRLITRRAFGFHSADALNALTMLTLADLCPRLPR